MANENAVLNISEVDNADSLDFDELENKLQEDLDSQLTELEFLKEDCKKIGNVENLGEVVKNMVWEQFQSQIGVSNGYDAHKAIKKEKEDVENKLSNIREEQRKAEEKIPFGNPGSQRGTGVRLAKELEAFEIQIGGKGTGNYTKEELKQWKSPIRNPSGEIRSVEASEGHLGERKVLEGHHQKNVNHHPEHQANPDNVKFYNPKEHLKQHDGNFRNKTDGEMVDRDRRINNQHKINNVKKTGAAALKSVITSLLLELLKEIMKKLVSWFQSADKKLESFLDSMKLAIKSFVSKLKTHLTNAGDIAVTAIVTAIYGPIIGTVKRIWIMLKQGWKSLKEAIFYLKDPNNRDKPFELKIAAVGKIVVAALSGSGALVLGEAIEKGLMLIPVIGMIQIPLLGSLASIIGLFLGGLVAGIIGAIALNLIDKFVASHLKTEVENRIFDNKNKTLNTLNKLVVVKQENLDNTKSRVVESITNRHEKASEVVKESLENISANDAKDEIIVSENEEKFNDMSKKLDEL